MGFRFGLIAGFGAGYVLGAKAGRERYEQIRARAGQLWQSERGKKIREQAHGAVETLERQATNGIRIRRRNDGAVDLTAFEDARTGGPA